MGTKEDIKRKRKKPERREGPQTSGEQSVTGTQRNEIVRQRRSVKGHKREKEKYSEWTGCRLVERVNEGGKYTLEGVISP